MSLSSLEAMTRPSARMLSALLVTIAVFAALKAIFAPHDSADIPPEPVAAPLSRGTTSDEQTDETRKPAVRATPIS
jgi:hypothetical protein